MKKLQYDFALRVNGPLFNALTDVKLRVCRIFQSDQLLFIDIIVPLTHIFRIRTRPRTHSCLLHSKVLNESRRNWKNFSTFSYIQYVQYRYVPVQYFPTKFMKVNNVTSAFLQLSQLSWCFQCSSSISTITVFSLKQGWLVCHVINAFWPVTSKSRDTLDWSGGTEIQNRAEQNREREEA